MKTMEIRALMENIAPVLKDYVSQSLSPVLGRLDAIDKRFSELPAPRDGKDADTEATANIIFLRLKPEIEELRATVSAVEKEIPNHIAEAISAMPVPKDGDPGADGSSVTVDDVAPLIAAETAKAFAAIPRPENGADGKSVTVDELAPVISAEVLKAVAAIPMPKDAPPISPEAIKAAVFELPDVISAATAKYLQDNPPPAGKDGVGMAGGLIDRDGNLILTTSNGAHHPVGRVVGKDAEPVTVNVPELDDEVSKSVASALRLLAERPEATKAVLEPPPSVINVTLERGATKKTVTTRRNKDGNLVGEIVESEGDGT